MFQLCTVLAHLTYTFLTEDCYGVIQKGVSRILEALLTLLSAIGDTMASDVSSLPSHKAAENGGGDVLGYSVIFPVDTAIVMP